MKYIDILLLSNGVFCVAPAWSVHEGDWVGLPDLAGEVKILEVVSTITDEVDGDYMKMIRRYVGYDLPRITHRYKKHSVFWEDEKDGLE